MALRLSCTCAHIGLPSDDINTTIFSLPTLSARLQDTWLESTMDTASARHLSPSEPILKCSAAYFVPEAMRDLAYFHRASLFYKNTRNVNSQLFSTIIDRQSVLSENCGHTSSYRSASRSSRWCPCHHKKPMVNFPSQKCDMCLINKHVLLHGCGAYSLQLGSYPRAIYGQLIQYLSCYSNCIRLIAVIVRLAANSEP